MYAGQMIAALWILASCDGDTTLVRSQLNEAKAALLRVAIYQERFYLRNRIYTNDMTQLGFTTDPFVTESGSYTIDVDPGADDSNYAATAKYNGANADMHECLWIRIDGRGFKTSGPHKDCWRR